jgi:ankyrin repeat protein
MKSRNNFRFIAYLIVAVVSFDSMAGSYEDFFGAIGRDDAASIVTLLQRGFDPNSRGPKGQVPLTLALQAQSLKVAWVLLDHPDLDIDAPNEADETPLMMAALKGELAAAQRLLERGARIHRSGWSPLHYAATGTEPKMVEMLLDRGAPVEAASPNRTSPLMMAARYGSDDSVALLLAHGADARRRNELGMTAADFARSVGRAALAARLDAAAR